MEEIIKMKIKDVIANILLDSRKEKTVIVTIKTNVGNFSASAPTGKSTGKYEAKSYRKSIEGDISKLKELSEYFSEEELNTFEDLKRVEDNVDNHIGANTLFALESAVLKAIAKEKKKEIWQLINSQLNKKNAKFPRLVGNCIGGGKHSAENSNGGKKPDFQEFLLIPEESILDSFDTNQNAQVEAGVILKNVDEKFNGKRNDENAWQTSLDNKKVLEVLKDLRENAFDEKETVIDLGLDIASSGFYSRKKYHYLNPKFERTIEEQLDYISNLISNFDILYIEDPFDEEDFESFSKLLKKFPQRLIVGDDLTVTNSKRLEKAIKMKSISGIIVKPNQCGSLIEVKKVVELAKKNNIKTIFSHRSGETDESILADLAFGFQADFFKCGISGKEREAKLKRLMEIEKGLI